MFCLNKNSVIIGKFLLTYFMLRPSRTVTYILLVSISVHQNKKKVLIQNGIMRGQRMKIYRTKLPDSHVVSSRVVLSLCSPRGIQVFLLILFLRGLIPLFPTQDSLFILGLTYILFQIESYFTIFFVIRVLMI